MADACACLVLIESPALVARALKLLRADPGGVRLLALSPSVINTLETAGVPFSTPEDYVDRVALYRRGRENYDLLEDLGRAIDAALGGLPAHLRLNPVFLHYYRLKVAVDAVGLRAHELAACLRALKPARLLVLADGEPVWADADSLHLLTPDGPIYAETAPAAARTLGVELATERAPAQRRFGFRLARRLSSAAKAAARGLGLIAQAAAAGGSGAVWQLGDAAHDVPEIRRALSRRLRMVSFKNALHGPLGAALSARPKAGDALALERFWLAVEPLLAKHPLFLYSGVDCWPLLRLAIRRMFVEEQGRAGRLHEALRGLIRLCRPRAALTVNTPYPENVIASWALRAEGVPVVYVQEGGLYGYCLAQMHHYCELVWGDYFLAYGRGPAEFLNATRLTSRQRAQALPVGALRLRRLKAETPARRPTAGEPPAVMYVASHFQHALRYAPLCYGDREYFTLRRRALKALLATPGIKILYKTVPGRRKHDDLDAFLTAHRDRIEVTDDPLPRVLGRADAFVLDWPTTALLELAVTDRPIHVLCDKDVTLPIDSAQPALRRRAEVHLGLEEFLRCLSQPPQSKPARDDGFLRDYGTGEWDEEQLVSFFEGLGRKPKGAP